MSATQVEEPAITIYLHHTSSTHERKIPVSAGEDLRQQVYHQATQDLGASAQPACSQILLAHSEFFTTFK